jgi:periplasmic divalent cation tolerance protein
MPDEYIIVLITVPSRQVAEQIAEALVTGKLAACVNILPAVRSIYTWKGALQREDELLLLVKTRFSLFAERLMPAVRALHPYETPEIIAVPVLAGEPAYLDWIAAETQS